MAKKANLLYDPNNKEPWHIAFEEEPVNDDFWSCIATAAIPAESEQDAIDMFNQVAETGIRRAIRTVTAADVVKTLKSTDKKTKEKGKETRKFLEPPALRPCEIVTFASRYASFGEGGCKLPPDLMAAVIKYLILNVKDQDCFQRRIDDALDKKLKEADAKKKFIKDYLQEEGNDEENFNGGKISDEPVGGPEIYILLSGFYDPAYFLELNRLKVTFLAFVRFERFREIFPKAQQESRYRIQKSPASEFWDLIKSKLNDSETTSLYKNIVLLKYNVPNLDNFESENVARSTIFDDVSQIQYGTFFIYKHHQNFLQQLRVHPVVECLKPLDLAECTIYNKLCDYFSPGDVGDEFLILYSMVEQVVAGIPETEYEKIEYELPETDFFRDESDDVSECEVKEEIVLVPPCKKCRRGCSRKKKENVSQCEINFSQSEKEISTPEAERNPKREEPYLTIALIEEVLKEKEETKKKYWKSPKIVRHDDFASTRCVDFDSRVIDPTSVAKRFWFDSMIPILWSKYPELSPAERTYYDYQFYRLWKITDEDRETFRLKVHFMIVMNMVAFAGSTVHRGDDDNVSQMWDVPSAGRSSKFSLPPIISDDKFRRSSGESVWGQISKTDFWRMFFKKIYDFPFSEGQKPKSIKIGFGFRRETEGCILRKVASASDLFKPCEIPIVSDLETSEPDFAKKASSEEIFQGEVDQLWKIFECPDISSLEDPVFLTDFDKFQDFAKWYNVYEELNPISMVQRLRSASDAYNVIQFNYFFPTDSLMLLMYNDCDYRGIYFDKDYGVLPTPVSLRDFYSFVFFEIKDWLKAEDRKYNEYVLRRKEKIRVAEKRKEDEILSKIRMKFVAMNEEEKAEFLGTATKPETKTGKKDEKGKKNDAQPTITEDDLEPLRKREKPKKPNFKSFDVTNLSDVRVQINTKNVQFHSRDGSNVNVITITWLYDPKRLIRLKLKKDDVEINYHYYDNKPLVKSFDVVTKSGIRIVFLSKPENPDFFFFMKATWPSGLIVETKLSPKLYIKQSYVENGPSDEKSRCFLREPKTLIFRKNGNVDALCADSTKYGCYEFDIPAKTKSSESSRPSIPKKNESKTKRKSKENAKSMDETENAKPQITIYDYDILTPTGEFFAKPSRPKGSNVLKLVDTLKVLVGDDKENEEIFYRREDGTNCMLWSDGKLVTTFRDGTKITLQPEFEEQEIFADWTEEEKLYFLRMEGESGTKRRSTQASIRSILRTSSQKSESSADYYGNQEHFVVEGFVSVKMSYLMEHPKYSTVFYPTDESFTQVNMPEIEILIRSNGTYKIAFEDGPSLNVSENKADFFQECFQCNKKSISFIDFSSDQSPNSILCKTVDFFDRAFVLHRNGETLVDSGRKHPEESDDISETEISKPEYDYSCDHDATLGSKQRLFVLERDLSGVEFLHDDALNQMFEDRSGDIEHADECRHFYKPLQKSKWTMDYRRQDSLPTTLKRKDLRLLGSEPIYGTAYRYSFPKKGSETGEVSHFTGEHTKWTENPGAVVLRIIRYLRPDPVKVLDGMVAIIKTYQNRSKESFIAYKEHSVPDETSQDERHIKMRLRKIALTLNQSLKFFDHSGIVTPSTDEDIHFISHRRDLNEYIANENEDVDPDHLLPDCKYVRNALSYPRRESVISEIMEL